MFGLVDETNLSTIVSRRPWHDMAQMSQLSLAQLGDTCGSCYAHSMEIPYRHRRRYEVIRRVVLAALGPTLRLLGRRRMAAFLRSLADELEERHIPRGHGGPAGEGIRWNGADRRIGYALWQAIGEAPRVSFEFVGSTTRIIPDADGAYRIRWARRRCARISCARLCHQAQWAEGWRPGRIERGAIVVDIEATRT